LNTLILLLAVFLVSTAGLFAHQALAEATPLAIAGWRLGLAALFFVGLSLRRRGEAVAGPIPKDVRWRLILAGLCLAGHFVTWFAALDRTSVARATLLACTAPLWTTLGSFLLGRRRPTGHDIGALAVAGIGLWLVTQMSVQTASHVTLIGDAFGISAGLLLGTYLLCVEGLHESLSSQRQVTVAYSVAAGVLWAVLLVRAGATLSYSSSVWKALLGMTLGPQIFGHTLLNWSLRHFTSSLVAFSILLEPIIAALLAWYLLGQTLTAAQLVGGLLVLGALALVISQKSLTDRIEAEPVG
jgi:drug/metabolite transporter (DMT)-like permease